MTRTTPEMVPPSPNFWTTSDPSAMLPVLIPDWIGQVLYTSRKTSSALYSTTSEIRTARGFGRRLNISTKQSICSYFILYNILDESGILQIPGENSSTAISKSRPESNGKTFGHSGSICLQEWATVEKQV
ncbi:hypothetical protein AVEN_265979-1 [Araneus ventricosus]|uniref:Uncharacterized protein n=1 Tax=Araneus ventricosus TaxID=182803 RepID=A0A4Y2GHF4_ARAVE|nr:hypothetical protein AVEN_265979-1 [Araneus ventricosus]